MRNTRLVALPVLILAGIVAAQQNDAGKNIQEQEAASGKKYDLVDGVETAAKIADYYSSIEAGKSVAQAASEIKGANYREVLKNGVEAGKQEIIGAFAVWRNGKQHLIKNMKDIARKIDDKLGKIEDRLEMWNNTLPMLEGYYETAKAVVDETKKTWKGLQFKDFWDLDRKWSRRMEANLAAYPRLYINFMSFLKGFLPPDEISLSIKDELWEPDPLLEPASNRRIAQARAEVFAQGWDSWMALGDSCVNLGAEAIQASTEILNQAKGPNSADPTKSVEQVKMEQVQALLDRTDGTYEDELELNRLLEAHREETRINKAQLNQIYGVMSVFLLRMKIRDKEMLSEHRGVAQKGYASLALEGRGRDLTDRDRLLIKRNAEIVAGIP